MLIAHDSKKAEGVTAFGETNLVMEWLVAPVR